MEEKHCDFLLGIAELAFSLAGSSSHITIAVAQELRLWQASRGEKITSLQTSRGENKEKNSEAGKMTKQNHGKENRHMCFPPWSPHIHTHADGQDKSKYNSNQNMCQQINLVS